MQSLMRSGGDREANLAKCRAGVVPKVRACMQAALNKANGRANVAITVEDGARKKEVVDLGRALRAGFVPPPRTINDITAVLDSEKPDPKSYAGIKAQADAEAGPGSPTAANFYIDRGNARLTLGRVDEALADAQKALQVASDAHSAHRARHFIGSVKAAQGDPKGALQAFQDIHRGATAQRFFGWIVVSSWNIIQGAIAIGDVAQAEGYLRQMKLAITEARTGGHPIVRQKYQLQGRSWEADYEASQAAVFEARGQYREAEAAYKRSADYRRAAITDSAKWGENRPPPDMIAHGADYSLLNVGRMKAKQGRLAEAEADIRQVLLSRLKFQGKYNPKTTKFVMGLANVLVDEGRYPEAEQLYRAALDIQRMVGIRDESHTTALTLSQLGAVLVFQRRGREAAAIYAELDRAISRWEPGRKQLFQLNGSRITALYASGQMAEGLAAAQALVDKRSRQLGERHFDTADARGTLAMGYALAGRSADAVKEFKTAIPILIAASRENAADDDDTVNAARGQRLRSIVESYIGLAGVDSGGDQVALETFALADAVRGQSVQRALSESSARSVAKDPALAEIVRNEQDLGKQINAALGGLNNALASDERDDSVIKATKASIDKLRTDRRNIRDEIGKRFPRYAELIDPRPPSVEQIKEALMPGESMLSFYFGHDKTFVWAIPKQGEVVFAAVNATAGEIQSKVNKLRESLEPQAALISDIPPFDVALAYEIYSLLLKPVESGWRNSKSLIVVTNGALGLLPLSLLPTAPATVASDDDPLFSGYGAVPWLARTHAVSMIPSSAALRTLRNLPTGKPDRTELIAFGDPVFSTEQENETAQAGQSPEPTRLTETSVTTRGLSLKRRSSPKLDGIDSAQLAMLPRLPDTAEELRSIALALQADPAKVLNLGKQANERVVKTTDLSGFKVLAFATHGLVPGELDGLNQPALALSAPAIAGVDGDGLLTMEEILSLKLDADWVVLSACNTGAASGAGAEAASGLGRAFFYAGTRAILVTNWSVHSQSAKDLVTDLFRRQAADPTLTRSEGLRQAMLALVDGSGYLGADGKTDFSYAHPLFWAPYSIIGDGGKR